MKNKTVCVGMSGGVDSSVAAYLLKKQGYHVIGITMQMWSGQGTASGGKAFEETGLSAIEDARKVAEMLEIPHHVVCFEQEFKKYVIDDFVNEYRRGHTPNPCVVCNRYVKWEALLKKAAEFGASYIATGHYARVIRLANGRYTLKNAVGVTKDQTYALYNLTQEQLARTIMPVGEYEKDEIRAIAAQIGLKVADKPDSQDICFIPDGDYISYLETKAKLVSPCGNFIDTSGNIIGKHQGITHYTIGQRKGLGIAMGHPVFVCDIRPETNEVVVGENEDIFKSELTADRVNYMMLDSLKMNDDFISEIEGIPLMAKIRYAHKGASCKIKLLQNQKMKVVFEEPVRAITKGQSVVVYAGDMVACGGIITDF